MSAWIVVPCLLSLRSEFNSLAPNRDKGADGTIGDSAHTSSSDHTPDEDSDVLRDHDADSKNEVHALDIDSSGPWPGTGTQKQRFHAIIMRIIAGERAKWLSATDKCRLNYVIWDGKIYDKDNDFQPRNYNGSDPHTNHAHFSSRYETSCENDTRPWGVLQEEEDEMTPEDFNKVRDIVRAEVDAGIKRVFTTQTFDWSADNPADPASYRRNGADLIGDSWAAVMRGTTRGGAPLPTDGSFGRILAAIEALNAKVDGLDVPTVTKEVVREAMIDIITGAATSEGK